MKIFTTIRYKANYIYHAAVNKAQSETEAGEVHRKTNAKAANASMTVAEQHEEFKMGDYHVH